MANTYIEYLQEEFKRAKQEFEKAKRETADELGGMNHFTAVDFGAAYASRIDRVTVAATKLRTIADVMQTYEYFQKEGSV